MLGGIVIGTLCGVAGYFIYKKLEKTALAWYKKRRYKIEARLFRRHTPVR